MRSVLATIALMIGCIVGGYAWSSLRAVSAKEELAATMEAEFTKQFAALAARQNPRPQAFRECRRPGPPSPRATARAGSAESLAHLPPCRIHTQPDDVGPVTCTDAVAQPIALCASIPSAAHTTNVRVQARVPKSESPWLERDCGCADARQPAHRRGDQRNIRSAPDQRSVCLDVANFSVEDTLAVRVIVEYAFGGAAGERTHRGRAATL